MVPLSWRLQVTAAIIGVHFLQSGNANPCPDGHFLNLLQTGNGVDECRPRDTSFGFDSEQFDKVIMGPEWLQLHLDDCTEKALGVQLERLKGHGGMLQLPACEIGLTKPIYIPNRTILQGAGIGQSVLFVDAEEWGPDGAVIRVEYPKTYSGKYLGPGIHTVQWCGDVVLRNFSVRGNQSKGGNLIHLVWADNVLVEHVEAYQAQKTALHFRHAHRVTIRYSSFHHSHKHHGIATKDCYWNAQGTGIRTANRSYCDRGNPKYWSDDYAIYSNEMDHNARGMGLDTHGSRGEIAGNLLTNNAWASKFVEPARDLFVHDNLFHGSSGRLNDDGTRTVSWGAKITNQGFAPDDDPRTDATLHVMRHAYYRNTFSSNGNNDPEGYGVRVDHGTADIFFLKNQYRGNGNGNKLRLTFLPPNMTAVLACRGDEVAGADISASNHGHPQTVAWIDSDDPRCNLSLVGGLFAPPSPSMSPSSSPTVLPSWNPSGKAAAFDCTSLFEDVGGSPCDPGGACASGGEGTAACRALVRDYCAAGGRNRATNEWCKNLRDTGPTVSPTVLPTVLPTAGGPTASPTVTAGAGPSESPDDGILSAGIVAGIAVGACIVAISSVLICKYCCCNQQNVLQTSRAEAKRKYYRRPSGRSAAINSEKSAELEIEMMTNPMGPGQQWREAQDDLGRTYYYCTTTGVSQWERPPQCRCASPLSVL